MKKIGFVKEDDDKGKFNEEHDENINKEANDKEEIKTLFTPFNNDFTQLTISFNEEKIKKHLKEIIPEKDLRFINHIINDKRYYFPNNLKIEKGVFRDNKGNLLEIVYEKDQGLNIPEHIMKTGTTYGLGLVSHNHINGLIIPSLKDMATMPSLQSKYYPIYSPNKTSLLVNSNISENKKNWKKISNEYNRFIKDTNTKIEKLYP